jgi:serine-type D-Ala-D-Ala carboxypeptidase (penicillin-binding protein 5/6)
MRLVARLMIAGVALATGGLTAGCSSAVVPDAQGATNPAAISPPGRAITATVPAAAATKTAGASGGPVLDVVGAPVGVKAKEGILVDAATGQVLWSKDANVPRPIASITKVMTALVILQSGGLNREITVPKAVVNYVATYGAEAAGLIPGQVYTTDELLHAILIVSAADAAYTLANAYGPGLPAFIAKMNAEAAKLGLTGTHFTSPDGLPYPTEFSTYSTPADLVQLGELAMANPVFRSIVDLQDYNLPKGDGHNAVSVTSDDTLLGTYAGAIGIKTGYTNAAGHTLLFEAVRNHRTLIGVVLGSPPTTPFTAAQDATTVLNWGFALKQSGSPT